jgi:CRISPR-associated endonuclease/helicase Cas3
MAHRNSNLWQIELEDEEGVQTRLNELPTLSLVLCRSVTSHEAVFADLERARLGNEEYRLDTAQAIHKNLVKVPEYCFERIHPFSGFTDYLYGNQSAGILGENGVIEVKGLKRGIRLFYSDEMGLVIERATP